MRMLLGEFLRDERGATSIEYGLIALLVAVSLIGVLGLFSESLIGTFDKVVQELDGVNGG